MTLETFDFFATVVTAIFLEAAPFLLLGSVVGALLEEFLPAGKVARILPQNRLGRILVGAMAGMILPTCECGVVPIVRRMMGKGVPVSAAVAYMLAAPVVNPVVIISTLVAFRGDWSMVIGRLIIVLVTAVGVALWLEAKMDGPVLRTGIAVDTCCGHGDEKTAQEQPPSVRHDSGAKLLAVLGHAANDFLDMGKYLVLGASAAGAIKTFLPATWLSSLSNQTVLAVGAMMLFAILASVCSEADSFIAASLATLPRSAQLAFISVGPMVDLKLIAMYGAVFKRRVVLVLVAFPVVLVLVQTLLWSLWMD